MTDTLQAIIAEMGKSPIPEVRWFSDRLAALESAEPVAWRPWFKGDDGEWRRLFAGARWESMPVSEPDATSIKKHPDRYRIEYAYPNTQGRAEPLVTVSSARAAMAHLVRSNRQGREQEAVALLVNVPHPDTRGADAVADIADVLERWSSERDFTHPLAAATHAKRLRAAIKAGGV